METHQQAEDAVSLLEDALQSVRLDSPDSFWACEVVLQAFLTASGAEYLVNAELTKVAADPLYQGNWGSNEIVLRGSHIYSLSLALFDAPRRYIHALPYYAYYVPLVGPIAYDVYSLPKNYRNDVFDPSMKLELVGTKVAAKKSIIGIRSDRYAYDFKISGTAPVLRLTTASVRPMEWLFSKNTLQAWQANDADLSYTQLRVAANVLGKIAHQSSTEPLRGLASHPHHAVRWAAIQNLGRLNRSEALVKIREAVIDPHPHVRRAAQATLDRLEGKVAK